MWQFILLLVSVSFVRDAGAESTWTNCETMLTTTRNSTDLYLNVEKHFELEFAYCEDSQQETFLINSTDGIIEVMKEARQLTQLFKKNCEIQCVALQFHLQGDDHERLVGYIKCSNKTVKYETYVGQCFSGNESLYLKAEGEVETCDNQADFDPKSCLPEQPKQTLAYISIGIGSTVFFISLLCTGLYFANRKYGWRVKLQRRTTWRLPVRRLLSLRSSTASSAAQGNLPPTIEVSTIESLSNGGTRASGSNRPRRQRHKASQNNHENEQLETEIINLERSPGRRVSAADGARSRIGQGQSSSSLSPCSPPIEEDCDDQKAAWDQKEQDNSSKQNSIERFEIHVSRVDPPSPIAQQQMNDASCKISLKPLVLEFRSPSCLSLAPQSERTECGRGFQTLPHPKPGHLKASSEASSAARVPVHQRPRALLPHEIAERNGLEIATRYPLDPPELPRSPLPTMRRNHNSSDAAGTENQASKRVPSVRPPPSMQEGVYDHLWFPPED